MHFHDNKYRFQSRRFKHEFDAGDIFKYNPLAEFYSKHLQFDANI